eukprot:2030979-Prorocentrum_lima.AAC.1
MTSSLVGSEMCIRDRFFCGHALHDSRCGSKVGWEKWRRHNGTWLANGSGGCMVVAAACDGQGTW